VGGGWGGLALYYLSLSGLPPGNRRVSSMLAHKYAAECSASRLTLRRI